MDKHSVKALVAALPLPPLQFCADQPPDHVRSACVAVQVCAAWLQCAPTGAVTGTEWQQAWSLYTTEHSSTWAVLAAYGAVLRLDTSERNDILARCAGEMQAIGVTGFGAGSIYTPPTLAASLVRYAMLAAQTVGLQAHGMAWCDPAAGSGVLLSAASTQSSLLFAADVSLPATLIHKLWNAQREHVRLMDGLTHPWHQTSMFGDHMTWKLPEPSHGSIVVISNPPYGNIGVGLDHVSEDTLRGKWDTLGNVWLLDGQHIGEKSTRALKDGCIRFLRWALFVCSQYPTGIFTLVISNNILDSPILRGVRAICDNACSHLWITNLHGNRRKDDHHEDTNVFPIQVGVTLLTGIVQPHTGRCQVRYQSCMGKRQHKLDWLHAGEDAWETLSPQAPYYMWLPQPVVAALSDKQSDVVPLDDIWKHTAMGFKTGSDALTLHDTKALLDEAVQAILGGLPLQQMPKQWNTSHVRRQIQAMPDPSCHYRRVLCGPYDVRWTLWSKQCDWIDHPAYRVLQHMDRPNKAILCHRNQQHTSPIWCANMPVLNKVVEHWRGSMVMPLYLHPHSTTPDWGNLQGNIHNSVATLVELHWQLQWLPLGSGDMVQTCGPDDLWNYCYALLHSPWYAAQSVVPGLYPSVYWLPIDQARTLCQLGQQGSAIHLMQTSVQEKAMPDTDTLCGQVRWNDGMLTTQGEPYMPLNQSVWQHQVGSFQVILAWLRARKMLPLTAERGNRLGQIIQWSEQDIAWRELEAWQTIVG